MTERRMLRYNFTPAEHLANCAEMARLYDVATEMEGTHKSIKAKLKEDEENTSALIGRACRLVRDQHDFRETECRWEMNTPSEGQKSCIRLDTGITVEVLAMQEWEKQGLLKFEPSAEDGPEGGTRVDMSVKAKSGCKHCDANIPTQDNDDAIHVNGHACAKWAGVTMTASDGEVLFKGSAADLHRAAEVMKDMPAPTAAERKKARQAEEVRKKELREESGAAVQ